MTGNLSHAKANTPSKKIAGLRLDGGLRQLIWEIVGDEDMALSLSPPKFSRWRYVSIVLLDPIQSPTDFGVATVANGCSFWCQRR